MIQESSDNLNFKRIYTQDDSKFEGKKNNKILNQIQIVSNYLNKPKELRRSPIRPVVNLTSPELQINHKEYFRKSDAKNNSIKKLVYSYDFKNRSIHNSSANIKDLKYIIERQKVREKFDLERFDDEINFSNRGLYYNSLKRSGR